MVRMGRLRFVVVKVRMDVGVAGVGMLVKMYAAARTCRAR